MAATVLSGSALVTVTSFYSTTGTTVSFQAADVANGNYVTAASDLLLIAYNSGAATHDVTVTSVADPTYGRTGNATKNMAAGSYQAFRLTSPGWRNTNDQIVFSADHADVKFAVVQLVS